MKMKEVLERTGLTDRAVRLYIANGLIAPVCNRGYTGQRGDWVCNSLTENTMDYIPQDYKYCIFAYNDVTQMVRYIYSYCMDAGGTDVFPYFLTLDWES